MLTTKEFLRLVGIDIANDFIWHGYSVDLTIATGKKPGFLFKAPKNFPPANLAPLLKAHICTENTAFMVGGFGFSSRIHCKIFVQ